MEENKTIDGILKQMRSEMPFSLPLNCLPYIREAMEIYAKQPLMNAPVFRICSHCNTEFELTVANSLTERVSAFENCTHCGKRNDTWISIRV